MQAKEKVKEKLNANRLTAKSLILAFIIVPISTIAQTNSSSLRFDAEEQKKLAERFKISVSLEGSSNLYDKDSPDREGANTLDLNPSFYLGNGYTLGNRTIITRDETEAHETTISNATISIKKAGPSITPSLGTAFSLTGVTPTNEVDRKDNRFQGGVSLAAQVKGDFKYLSYTYSLTGRQNFHEFTQASDGSSNIQYSLTNELSLEIEFVPKWSLAVAGYARRSWAYQGSSRQSYGNEVSISNQVAKQWSLAAGFRNEGAAFKADGVSSNIKVFDQNSSVIFASLTVTN